MSEFLHMPMFLTSTQKGECFITTSNRGPLMIFAHTMLSKRASDEQVTLTHHKSLQFILKIDYVDNLSE